MKGKTLVREIVIKDLYDKDVYIKITKKKLYELKKIIDDEVNRAEKLNFEPRDILLTTKGVNNDFNDKIYITIDKDYNDGMPF